MKKRPMVWEAALLIDALTPLHAAQNGLGEKPYLGWSSWSLQATKYPGYGGQAWLTAQHVNAGQGEEVVLECWVFNDGLSLRFTSGSWR